MYVHKAGLLAKSYSLRSKLPNIFVAIVVVAKTRGEIPQEVAAVLSYFKPSEVFNLALNLMY